MRGKYANIIVDIAHEKVDRPFQYRIPDQLLGKIEEGMAVTIPFGRGNKIAEGIVLSVEPGDEKGLKQIQRLLEEEPPLPAVV